LFVKIQSVLKKQKQAFIMINDNGKHIKQILLHLMWNKQAHTDSYYM